MDSIGENFLEHAKKEARIALMENEVPVGVVIVQKGEIIAAAHNLKENLKDVTAHAEILAIRMASEKIGNWRLSGCDMYVTLEPCPMCAAAIGQARISNLYIGALDSEAGGCGSVINLVQNEDLKYFVKVNWLYDEESSQLLSEFFKKRRNK